MTREIFLAFRKPPQNTAERGPFDAAALAGVPGVVAARAYEINVLLGERPPASYPQLVIGVLDEAGFDAVAALEALGADGSPGAGAARLLSWEAVSVGPRSDFDLPPHLYLQFSANPPSMDFESYSDWYQVHQDENIAQTDTLRRGWRFRLDPRSGAPLPGPAHLALYEIEGAIEQVTGDLGRAMRASVISLPGWFDRFASLEGTSAAERVGAAPVPA